MSNKQKKSKSDISILKSTHFSHLPKTSVKKYFFIIPLFSHIWWCYSPIHFNTLHFTTKHCCNNNSTTSSCNETKIWKEHSIDINNDALALQWRAFEDFPGRTHKSHSDLIAQHPEWQFIIICYGMKKKIKIIVSS